MSFYTSLNGLKNAQTDLGVIAHNIANAETNGFKKGRTEFADIVVGSDPRMTVGIGATVEAISQNFALGPIEQTGSALDIAITGDGFFATRSAETGGTFYTRNGAFTIDGDGFVHDGSDNRLQVFPTDAAGNITGTAPVDARIPATSAAGAEFAGLTVAGDGTVTATYSDASVEAIGSVALASFISPGGLKQVGSSNWQSTGISGAPAFGSPGQGQYGSLRAGALERSNVDIADDVMEAVAG